MGSRCRLHCTHGDGIDLMEEYIYICFGVEYPNTNTTCCRDLHLLAAAVVTHSSKVKDAARRPACPCGWKLPRVNIYM